MQLEHACGLLLQSELFAFHSERMCDNIVDQVQKVCKGPVANGKKSSYDLINYVQVTDPHPRFILYSVILFYGRKKTNFLRAHKRWQPLISLLIGNISVGPDSGAQGTHGLNWPRDVVVPIESKIRTLSIFLLYEVCRVQKLSFGDLSKPPSSRSPSWP